MEKRSWDAEVKLEDGRDARISGDVTMYNHSNLASAERELISKLEDEYERKVGKVSRIKINWK